MDQNEKYSLKHSLINFNMLENHSYTLPTVTVSNITIQSKNNKLIAT